ncbi:Cytochrome c oxidase, subunit IIc [Pseudooceanicola batsensis HTCC2597]|uniref:Cytochrome aa3 subunit 2 n=2 Tax=Pseudooceanicola batsensis TaxID=314255 RepID=A3U3Z7_PSEBH|nr:cytochrome c oxidase subunit II [Pseudooceanicola batsensis]EAQ01133.1 Cytochrome c oxidase, subunit IIc [Pseudooceanicola batsensis HTCC2597]
MNVMMRDRNDIRRSCFSRVPALTLLSLLVLAGCGREQSALNVAGRDAAAISLLFWVMLVGAVLLWLMVNGAFLYVSRFAPGRFDERHGRRLLIGGGIVLPTVVLTALLVWGLSLLPDSRTPGDGLVVRVTGEQWWWRVEYWPEGATEPVVSANEIRLPVGERTEFRLLADKVIHSFWIPALGGKMDMFPGRETTFTLLPDKPGTYRGQCAEFCGASHAWMAFVAVAMEPEEFDAWLQAQAEDAAPPADDAARRGQAVFRDEGCGACHTVRGTDAVGQVGPDLTHIGSRLSLGAGRARVTLDDLATWVAHTDALKPEVRMPSYDLGEDELRDLAHYLKGLR